jgi:hypothetical protein
MANYIKFAGELSLLVNRALFNTDGQVGVAGEK